MEMIKKLKKYGWIVGVIKNAEKVDRSNIIEGYKNRKSYYTSPIEGFEANLKDMIKCAQCPNMCRFDCPALLVSKVETFAPANKARIGLFMGMKHISMTEPTAIETMYACMNCDACYEWCPMSISTGNLLTEMRFELEKNDLIPEHIQKLKKTIESNGTVFENNVFKEFVDDETLNHNDNNPELLYYVGCMDLKHRKESVRATIALLKHLGVKFCTKYESRECCTGPVYKVGFKSVAQKMAQKNIQLIQDSKVKTVLTTCPGCLQTLKITYEEKLGQKLKKVNIVHAIDFFKQKIEDGSLKLPNKITKTMTYHDPCILSRSSSQVNNYEASRELFKLIPGLIIQEPYLHGKETRCCGMGGGYHVSNPEYSKQEETVRYGQLKKLGSDFIASGCPTCEFGLKEAQDQVDSGNDKEPKCKIVDIVELIAQAANIEYNPK